MLEQRRAKEKGYITLKEAAEIANYSPDYIGQLIRAGKIRGEQVYSSVAWVTTEDEVHSYLNDKGRVVSSDVAEMDPLAHPAFKFFLYGVISIIAVVLLLLQYILYVSIDSRIADSFAAHTSSLVTDS